MRKGFTLVELMIVIAIIAIIIAIAIPNLLSGRISANETSAIGTLKQFTSTQAIWLQQGPDGNGIKDYWTYDVSGLHRTLRADNLTKVAFIPLDVAQADPRSQYGTDPFGVGVNMFDGDWTLGTTRIQPKSGYWFTVLDREDLAGALYNINEIVPGDPLTLGCNHNRYGFAAAPDVYGSSGVRTFIVNEAGTIYASDTGFNATTGNGFPSVNKNDPPATAAVTQKWDTDNGGNSLCWPTQNPITVQTLMGKFWQSAE